MHLKDALHTCLLFGELHELVECNWGNNFRPIISIINMYIFINCVMKAHINLARFHIIVPYRSDTNGLMVK